MNCPHCKSDMQGAPIPQEHREAGYYGDLTHYSRVIGVEIQGVYDGVLYFQCPDCGKAWQRWSGIGGIAAKAERYIEEQNERAEAA